MRIAITGATGFIGRELVARVRERGHEVIAISRSAMPGLHYEDADAMARAIAGADAVAHLAARAHVGGTDDDFECNVRSARAIAAAARTAGVRRIVLLSSIGVNGNVTGSRAFTESDAPAPVEPYARSKLRAESEICAAGAEWVILRPPLVYGANAPGNFARLVRAVARGVPLPLGSVRNRRSLIGVRNLCDLVVAASEQAGAANQVFLAADGEDVSTPEMVESIAQGLGTTARLWRVPPFLLEAAAALAGRRRIAQSLCESLQVDASKARRLLGWTPAVATREGIVQAAAAWKFA